MLFVGGGFDLGRIKRYAKKLDIEDKIIFTGEVKDRELLQGYYLRSDLMIFPSTFDTAGIVKVEAAAHKKAGIFIENSCSGELVEHDKNGFLCEENAESLAQGIIRLCDREDYLKEIGEVAYKTLYRSWDMLGDEVIEKYEKIVADYKEKLKKAERKKNLLKSIRGKKIKPTKNI
jgi:glycosyltransferase involved in cell wall biosynthesis